MGTYALNWQLGDGSAVAATSLSIDACSIPPVPFDTASDTNAAAEVVEEDDSICEKMQRMNTTKS